MVLALQRGAACHSDFGFVSHRASCQTRTDLPGVLTSVNLAPPPHRTCLRLHFLINHECNPHLTGNCRRRG